MARPAASSNGNGMSKADAIRQALAANPKAKTREIIEYLASQGVKVSPNHVYILKSQSKRGRRSKSAGSNGAGRPAGSGSIRNYADAVIRVKRLAIEVGSMRGLKELVDAIAD